LFAVSAFISLSFSQVQRVRPETPAAGGHGVRHMPLAVCALIPGGGTILNAKKPLDPFRAKRLDCFNTVKTV
jgi:hypothetical protein